ncbi:SDR family NAD(P)-dependent oxidoreductase [Methylocapsa palsarum]|uniref:Short-chain dehydrogenase n=1 Tax=Methylocapsa palsarum TaxID=1612308 RepID=A0A1I4BFC7_9HYPH|nr:SDR family NAD(P)-dependent oxidoreductase [Methylocapsa palsarum]SFK66696.1 Short-chain dehydrogenase [Methylocapsa palsarum]
MAKRDPLSHTPTKPGAVWVTGAGKGIGRALALRLAARGHTVAASARTGTDLESLAAEAEGLPGSIFPVTLDVADAASVKAAIDRIEQAIGPLDLAILNAGTHQPLSAKDFDVSVFRSLIDVNLMGTVHCLAEILPGFIGRRAGTIAVVSSVAGYRGLPTAAAYGATKAALINMCEALKPELDQAGVRLALINPGFVDTPLTRRNDFPMPFLISSEEAADHIMRGLDRGAFEIVFPWRMALAMKLLRLMPYSAYFALSRRMLPAQEG